MTPLENLIRAAKVTLSIVEGHRLDSMDQNPKGFRDDLCHTIHLAEAELKRTKESHG